MDKKVSNVSKTEKMDNILVIIDMQNDFVTGSLGSKAAQIAADRVAQKLSKYGKRYSHILLTKDTHDKKYLNTLEGKHLPTKHCIKHTDGYKIVEKIYKECRILSENGIYIKNFNKDRYVCNSLVRWLKAIAITSKRKFTVEIIGLCTDICVVSNALAIRGELPEIEIKIDINCCAGTTLAAHNAALRVMENCNINTHAYPVIRKEYKEETKENNKEDVKTDNS